MTLNEARKIHCLGIGGIGVSALAEFFRAQGKEVSGYDDAIPNSQPAPYRTYSGAGFPIPNDVDLVVYSDAVPEDHPQRVAARAAGVPEISYAQALGQLSRQYRTIVVTGTHGKSTTTALLGLMLEAAGMDPLVIVGTKVPGWLMGNLRLPSQFRHSERSTNEVKNPVRLCTVSFTGLRMTDAQGWFVVEGDDYRDHFLELQPYAVVVTNIEHDHPDYFQDLKQTVESFRKLVEKVPQGGFTLINEDDEGCRQLFSMCHPRPGSGIHNQPKVLDPRFRGGDSGGVRWIQYGPTGEIFSKLHLQVLGEFNRYNATAAATAAMALGVPREAVEKVAREFKGVWRRFEIVGELDYANGHSPTNHANIRAIRGEAFAQSPIIIISDYGHHPTAIAATMKAARQFYPDRRLVLVYQPHQHSRTKHLFNDFVRVLRDASDVTIISEIYAVKGRMEDHDVNSRELVEAIKSNDLITESPNNSVRYGGDLQETKRVVLKHLQPGDVVIFMGAGDIDNLARTIVKEITQK